MERNRGIDWVREEQERSDEDWILGGDSPVSQFTVPENLRTKYLPQGEVQRGKEDYQDCVTRAYNNKLETWLNYGYKKNLLTKTQREFLYEYGYVKNGRIELSDPFTAILSKTTRQGNSLKAPADAIHRYGCVPKHLLPVSKSMTWEEYHDPRRITPEILVLGKKFLEHFSINYERVYSDQFEEFIKEDMVVVAGYAWPKPKNGIYPRVEYDPTHSFLFFGNPVFTIFDNYEESPGDFIKRLAPDYKLMNYGYRLIITESEGRITMLKQIISLCEQVITLLTKKLGIWKNS